MLKKKRVHTFEMNHPNPPKLFLPDLVADPSGEESHELWGLVALDLPVLDGVAAQEVVQLGGQHGARHLLVPGRLLACNREQRTNC